MDGKEQNSRRAGEMTASYNAGQQIAMVLYESCSVSEAEVLKVLRKAMPWWPFAWQPFGKRSSVTFDGKQPTLVAFEFWTIVDGQATRFRVGVGNNYLHGKTEAELEELLSEVVQGLRALLRYR